MIQHAHHFCDFTTGKAVLACGLFVVLVPVVSCTSKYDSPENAPTDEAAAARVGELRDLAAAGDQQSTERLIGALDDDSEWCRRAAQRGLEFVLKRKIYFDPAAEPDERKQKLAEVRAMWQSLVDRDLFEVAKKRMPIQYFYDLHTQEIFEARAGMAPIETPSGPYGDMPAGVRAVVFACRDCGDDRYVAWLQVPVAQLEQYGVAYDSTSVEKKPGQADLAIRSPDGGDWTLLGSPAAEAITSAARRCADRETPLFCRPGR